MNSCWKIIFIKLLAVCSLRGAVCLMEPSILIEFTTHLVKTQEAVVFACSKKGN